MATINISLPAQLKAQAEELVDLGFYSSFSDVIRDALRRLVQKDPYEDLIKEAKRDYAIGKSTVLETDEDVDKFFDSLK
ncbi:MAG: type II toxin-antitoxin system ParD family antitoxin [Patescibacteria group bacterium]